jgi:pimeloyl-ACP methyl ester carboxylesterase
MDRVGSSSPGGGRGIAGPAAAVLLLALAAAIAGCRGESPEPGGPGAPGEGSTPGPAPTATPKPFESGYLHPPTHDRVVIFVNGVFGDSVSTWTNAASGAYWPELLSKDPAFLDTDVYVHSFQSPMLGNAQEILELAGRLKNYLDATDVIAKHKQVVFVCHSMGGLVVRAYLLDARLPPDKIGFLFFFGTPTGGANIAGIAAHLTANPQLANMEPLGDDTYVKTLREQWLRSSDDSSLDYPRSVSSYCAYEKKPTWGFTVVPELSATYLCNRATAAIDANHLDLVKPADRNAEPYVALAAAYKNQLGSASLEVRSALAEVRPTMPVSRQAFRIADLSTAKIALRREKASQPSLSVACGETKEGEATVPAELAEGETVTEVHPTIVNASGLRSSSAVVLRFDGKTAVVRYRLEGACPAGGRGDVAINFVTTHRLRFPATAIRFVRPAMRVLPTPRVGRVPAPALEHVRPVAVPTRTP